MLTTLLLALLALGSAFELRPPLLRAACTPRVSAMQAVGDASDAALDEVTEPAPQPYGSLLDRADMTVAAPIMALSLAVLAFGFSVTGGRGGLDNAPLIEGNPLAALAEKQARP